MVLGQRLELKKPYKLIRSQQLELDKVVEKLELARMLPCRLMPGKKQALPLP
jgi:hypothetical protein